MSTRKYVLSMIFLALSGVSIAGGQVAPATATCWPQPSDLAKHHEYFCAVSAQPGQAVQGRDLMEALAELEPLSLRKVAEAGADQNRTSSKSRLARIREYGLDLAITVGESYIIAGGEDVIAEDGWRVLAGKAGSLIDRVIPWWNAATRPLWAPPQNLIPESDLGLDAHGGGSYVLYTRRDGGVRRVTLGSGSIVAPSPVSASPLAPDAPTRTVPAREPEPAEVIPSELAGLLHVPDIQNPHCEADMRWIVEYYRSLNNEAEAEAVLARGYQSGWPYDVERMMALELVRK